MAKLRLNVEEWLTLLKLAEAAMRNGDRRPCVLIARHELKGLLQNVAEARREGGDPRPVFEHECDATCETMLARLEGDEDAAPSMPLPVTHRVARFCLQDGNAELSIKIPTRLSAGDVAFLRRAIGEWVDAELPPASGMGGAA